MGRFVNNFKQPGYLSILFLMFSCSTNSKEVEPPPYTTTFDSTDLRSIIDYDARTMDFFPKGSKPAKLNEMELKIVDSLVKAAVHAYNAKTDSANRIFPLREYRQQIVPVLRENGSKEVYLNCFRGWHFNDHYWKNKMVEMNDGGRNYFQVKLTLQSKKLEGFWVSGGA